ncbi:fructose transport system permease protein [Deinococcus metalli]|uniref:Fructose transport system permease protein n=1 Tax=Deinococcus metalli TaxID=1141878 RepID=A0A7W8KIW2_9DEIO|nr:ABC transporter permease [Deinococcus metalli]MBB5377791.1 fructose transport system permease protein [Deinococcus metalli]GHF55916.1 monosaccharide-transporting ATPase [Deinococcus metalli]
MTQPTTAPPAKSGFQMPSLSTLGPLIALLLACIFFATQSDRFLTGNTLSLVLKQISYVAVLAIGQTLIILTAGIDLSCGVIMALGSMVMTKLAVEQGVPAVLAILLGLALTTVIGGLNGVLITRLRLPPFIATLGMYGIVFATTQIYSNAQTINNLPPALNFLGNTFNVLGVPFTFGAVLMVLLFALAWFFLGSTATGRHVYALGNNPEAVRLSGIFTDRLLIGVYATAGLFYGIAALILVGRVGAGDPNAGQTENLESITAAVLGGTSLFGGRGNVLGTLLGAIIVGVFRVGLTLAGVNSVYQVLITGILIILAVATDQFSRRKS